jgi:hypothetical protein
VVIVQSNSEETAVLFSASSGADMDGQEIEALKADAILARHLVDRLRPYMGEFGYEEGPEKALDRILSELHARRENAAAAAAQRPFLQHLPASNEARV